MWNKNVPSFTCHFFAARMGDCCWEWGGRRLLGEITCQAKKQGQRIQRLGVWKEGLEHKPLLFLRLLLIAMFEIRDLWRKHYSKWHFPLHYKESSITVPSLPLSCVTLKPVGVQPKDTTKPKTGRRKDLLLFAASKENFRALSQSSVSLNSKVGEILS